MNPEKYGRLSRLWYPLLSLLSSPLGSNIPSATMLGPWVFEKLDWVCHGVLQGVTAWGAPSVRPPLGFHRQGPKLAFWLAIFAKGPKNNNLKFQNKSARTFGMLGVHFRHTYAKSECMWPEKETETWHVAGGQHDGTWLILAAWMSGTCIKRMYNLRIVWYYPIHG